MIYKLEDICIKVCSGGTPNRKHMEYYSDGNIPWLNTGEINFNRIKSTVNHITEIGLNNSSAKWVPENTVIVAMYGATAGKSAIAKIPLTTNQACCNLIINDQRADYRYVYYYLYSRYEHIASLANGGAQQNLNAGQIREYLIDLPSLDIQQKVADILESLDSKIEQNQQINDNLEQQAFALFDHMFPSVSVGNCYIGDIITPQRGKGLLSKDAIPGDVPVIAGGLEPATYHNTSNTISPVLTISASGANAGFVNLWNVPVWSSDSSFIDSNMTKDVYFWYVMLKKRQKEIFDAQTGSAQPHIYPKHIAAMPVSELKQEDITRFTHFVNPLFHNIGKNKSENIKLSELRDQILPKLMSGELDVSEIDI